MKLLIVQDKGIGDLIFLTAVLPLIKKEYEITVMTPYPELLRGNPYVKQAIKPEFILPTGYDLYADLWNNKTLYRFPGNTIKPREFKNFTLHEIERYQIALRPILEKMTRDVKPELYLKKAEPRNRVGIMMGARISSRTWTDQDYDKLIKYLEPNYEIAIFGKDTSLSLDRVAEEMSQCKYFIGNDTGLTHMVAALGIPLITLYFNKVQNPLRWTPWGVRQLLARSKTECYDKCRSTECENPVCRNDLKFDEVIKAFYKLAEGNGFTKREGSLFPLAKESLFILLFGDNKDRAVLENNGFHCFYLPRDAGLFRIVKTIRENNINIVHSYFPAGIKLKLAALIGSNYVPEYPLIVKDDGLNNRSIKELVDFYLESVENITNESFTDQA